MNRRHRLLVWLVLTVVVGLGSRMLISPMPWWVKEVGDVLWAMAIYAAVALAFPGWRPLRVGAVALGLAWVSELTQLIRTPWMRSLRRIPFLGMLLGSGFSWIDMGMYVIGAALAMAIDRWLIGRAKGG
jgi:hypothetical protein